MSNDKIDERKERMMKLITGNFHMHQEVKQSALKAFHNTIFVIGTGTFVLSVSFIGYLKVEILWPCLLILTWILLILSIGSDTFMTWCTVRCSLRDQNLLNKWTASNFTDPPNWNMDSSSDEKIKTYTRWIYRSEKIAVASLLSALVSLVIFASINLLAQNEVRRFNDPLSSIIMQRR